MADECAHRRIIDTVLMTSIALTHTQIVDYVDAQFESQDILVPWRTPDRSSSEEKTEVGGNEHESIATTTTTSDEDVTHYHAYSQTSESDSCYSCNK